MSPKKILIIILVILGIGAYAFGSVWVIRMLKNSNVGAASTTNSQAEEFSPAATNPPTPTKNLPPPAPLQGPGEYACDPYGICNHYSDEMRKFCPVTYADRNCLNKCGDQSTHCSQ